MDRITADFPGRGTATAPEAAQPEETAGVQAPWIQAGAWHSGQASTIRITASKRDEAPLGSLVTRRTDRAGDLDRRNAQRPAGVGMRQARRGGRMTGRRDRPLLIEDTNTPPWAVDGRS